MKTLLILSNLFISNLLFADFLCDMEYQKIGCDRDDPTCLISSMNRIDKKCHQEISEKLVEAAKKEPCFEFAKKCGENVTSECLEGANPECQQAILKNEKTTKLVEKDCDFSIIEQNCPLKRTDEYPLGNMQEQMKCFNEHKHKLGTSCLNILENASK